MAANRVGRRLGGGRRRASPARSGRPPAAALSPAVARAERTPSPGIQRRQARVTVKYDRRELQRRLDTEKWIDARLEELYRGRVSRRGRSGAGLVARPGQGRVALARGMDALVNGSRCPADAPFRN